MNQIIWSVEQMNNIYKDIIVYKGHVGKLIEKKHNRNTIYKFYPAGYSSYYEEELTTVENPEAEVKLANSDEGREYAISEFRRFHKMDKYIAISNFLYNDSWIWCIF